MPDCEIGGGVRSDPWNQCVSAFLCGRMIGAAAEIDDHLTRVRNTDTRTSLDHCGFVA
jgi:hypothetical protein